MPSTPSLTPRSDSTGLENLTNLSTPLPEVRTDIPSQAGLTLTDSTNNPSIVALAADNTVEGVSLSKFVEGKRVVILADSNHDNGDVQAGIVKTLSELRSAGFNVLALEVPEGRSLDEGREKGHSGWIPHADKSVLREALRLEMAPAYVDIPDALQVRLDRQLSETDVCTLRGQYMGTQVLKLLSDPEARVVIAIGLAHVESGDEIRAILAEANVLYTAIGVFARGQSAYLPFAGPRNLIPLEFVRGVTALEPSRKSCTVDLRGSGFCVDGFIICDRVRVDPNSTSTPVSNSALVSVASGFGALTRNDNSGALTYLSPLSPVHVVRGFAESMVVSSRDWQADNEKKITDFCAQLASSGAFAPHTGLYLAMTLHAAALGSGEHSFGGSIAGIEYVPTDGIVRLTVIDLCGYEFDPAADYGSREQTYEFSLPTLEEKFGINELLAEFRLKCGSTPNLQGLFNKDDPAILVRAAPFVMAAVADPNRIIVNEAYSKIFVRKDGAFRETRYLVELRPEDFAKSDAETALLAAQQQLYTLTKQAEILILHKAVSIQCESERSAKLPDTLGDVSLTKLIPTLVSSGLKNFYQWASGKAWNVRSDTKGTPSLATELYEAGWASGATFRQECLGRHVQNAILHARKGLKHLGDSDVSISVHKMTLVIGALEKTIEAGDRFLEAHPSLRDAINMEPGNSLDRYSDNDNLRDYCALTPAALLTQLREGVEIMKLRIAAASNKTVYSSSPT